MSRLEVFVLAALFNSGWFVCVFLGRAGWSEYAILVPMFLLAFLWMRKLLSGKFLIGTLALAAVGIAFDSMLLAMGEIKAVGTISFMAPIWLVSLWLLFSFSMGKLGAVLNFPVWVSALLGGVLGPISYKSGEVFQVLNFSSSMTILIYAVFWAIFFPAVVIFSKRLL